MQCRRGRLLQILKRRRFSTACKTKTNKNLDQKLKNNFLKKLENSRSDEQLWENEVSVFSIKEQTDQTITVASVRNNVSIQPAYVKIENLKTKFILDAPLVIDLIKGNFQKHLKGQQICLAKLQKQII